MGPQGEREPSCYQADVLRCVQPIELCLIDHLFYHLLRDK